MSSENHIRTRERAYHIWERQGRPAGLESEHWLQAEQELATEPKAAAKTAASASPAEPAATASPAEPAATKPRARKASPRKPRKSAATSKSPKSKSKQA